MINQNKQKRKYFRYKKSSRLDNKLVFYNKYKTEGKWSRKYDKCKGCNTIVIPHWAQGYCQRCYPKFVIRQTGYFDIDNPESYAIFMEKAKKKKGATWKAKKGLPKVTKILNTEKLKELYIDKKMSLEDIARQFGCSRVWIWKLCIKYGIKVKTKSQARKDAYSVGKKIRFHHVNENFFENWSNEMTWVLGFFCADGNISGQMNFIRFAQKEIEILEKVKRVMQAEQNIVLGKYKTLNLYTLDIGNQKLIEDLLKLGITTRKSLTLKFPNMPNEYVSHFIRGYFDGDGSIYQQKGHKSWKVSILTGSENFIKELKEKLETLSGLSQRPIYKANHATAYYIRYSSKNDITKLYNFFYDDYTLAKELYLTRKYLRFKEAIDSYKNWTPKQIAASERRKDKNTDRF